MSKAATAFLILYATVLLLLIIHRLPPIYIYKIDYAGGYKTRFGFFVRETSHIFLTNPDKVLDIHGNDFNNHKKYVPPVIDGKDVVVLSERNFSHFVAKNRHVMVNFYAPWCYWSQKLAPEYALAATELKGEAVLAKVDAITYRELAKKYKIQAYPTICFFDGGVEVETYYNERTLDAIAKWMRTKVVLGGITTIMTTEQAEQALMVESTKVLGFLDSLEGLDAEELVATSKLHTDVIFYQTTSADVEKRFKIYAEIKRPALILMEKETQDLSYFNGPFTKSAISEFIYVNKLSPVTTFTNENAPMILKSSMRQLWLFALTHDSKVTSIFQEIAKAFKAKMLFVYVKMDCRGAGRQIASAFGIRGPALRGPSIIAYTGYFNAKKYVLKGELTQSNIKSFAENFLEDKLSGQPDALLAGNFMEDKLASQPETASSETEFFPAKEKVANIPYSYTSGSPPSQMNYVYKLGWI